MQGITSYAGGAIIGRVRISLPTTLLVSSKGITVKAFSMGAYHFYCYAVTSVEAIGNSKIAIHHTLPDYPERILFISSNAKQKVRAIKSFLPHLYSQTQLSIPPPRKGWPVRWQFILLFLIWWNGTHLIAFQYPSLNEPIPLPFILVFSTFIGSILLLNSSKLQPLLIPSNRRIGEVKPVLILISYVTGLLSLVMVLGLTVQKIQGLLH